MSGSNAYSTAKDVTHKQPKPGPGMNCDRLWMCGHKGRSGEFKLRVPWRCAACVEKGPR